MEIDRYAQLKLQYNFESWRGRSTLGENLFIWQFLLAQNQLSGWHAQKIQQIAAPPQETMTRSFRSEGMPAEDEPRLTRSIWRRSLESQDELVSLDVFECSSGAFAHELVIRLLGEFQSPLMAQQAGANLGDVVFAHPGKASYLFARGNLVVLVSSAGSKSVPVATLARQLDGDLVLKPRPEASPMAASISRFESSALSLQLGQRAPIDLEIVEPGGRPVMVKFFSRKGAVVSRQGQLVYEPKSAGEQDLEAIVMTPSREVSSRALRFTVSP
jgi:hypothetical protein